MKATIISLVGSTISTAVLVQKQAIELSVELALAVLVNIVLIALAFGGIQATLKHLRSDITRIERQLERRRFPRNENANVED